MIDFDTAAPYPELRQLRNAVVQGDWPAISAFFAGVTDPDDHSYAAEVVAATHGSEDFLASAAQQQPGTLAKVLYADRLINLAWQARTTLRAEYVKPVQFATFHKHLCRAEPILIEVTAREPENTTAWFLRLLTGRGLELGQAEVRRRYDRMRRHAPHFFAAQAQMVQQLCPKWGGSVEALRLFSVDAMLAAPPGSLAPVGTVAAHIEIGLVDRSWPKAVAYLRRPEVQAQIHDAADRSVRHPNFRADGYRAIEAHGMFALVFGKIGDHAAAKPHFQAIGQHAVGRFWDYFDNPRLAFAKLRARALRA